MSYLDFRVILMMWLISACNYSIKAQDIDDAEAYLDAGDTVFFDYRLHRNPTKVFKEQVLPDSNDHKVYTYLFHGNPIISYQDGRFFNTGDLRIPYLPYRLDIELQPSYTYVLGPFNDPFQTQLGISPRVQYNFGKGVYGVFQWVFPIQNHFKNEFGQSYRPGEIGIGYDHIYKGLHAFRFYGGTLTNNQAGFQGEYLGRDKKGVFYYGAALYYTRKFVYDHMYTYWDVSSRLSGYVQAAYRISPWDLTVRLIGDMYLNGKLGVTMEVIRQYGNTDVGFFAIGGQGGSNAGFFFRMPFWPRKFYRNNWMQVRLPQTFNFYYNVRTISGTPRVRNYNPLFKEVLRFNPNFLNGQMDGTGY